MPARPARHSRLSTFGVGTLGIGAIVVMAGCGSTTIGESEPIALDRGSLTAQVSHPSNGAVVGSAQDSSAGTHPSSSPVPTPGPGAPGGCAMLLAPLQKLATDPTSRTPDLAQEVRRLASGVDDNALGAVSRRIAGNAARGTESSAAIAQDWAQIREICRL